MESVCTTRPILVFTDISLSDGACMIPAVSQQMSSVQAYRLLNTYHTYIH